MNCNAVIYMTPVKKFTAVYLQPQTSINNDAFSEFNEMCHKYLRKDELKHVLKDYKQAPQVW